MALIQCHECGKPVSTEASACPNCGAPPRRVAPNVATKASKKKSPIPGLIGVGVVVVLVAMCSSSEKKPAASTDQEQTKPAKVECEKGDLQCNGDKAVIAASVYCKDSVERMAKHSVKWTDGTFELKFSRFRWKDKDADVITLVGDKAEFQNGFGAYTPVTYECDLATDRKTVLDVRVREGRLPG